MILISVGNLPPNHITSLNRFHDDLVAVMSTLNIPGHEDKNGIKVKSKFKTSLQTSFDDDIIVEIKVLENKTVSIISDDSLKKLVETVRDVTCEFNRGTEVYCHVTVTNGFFAAGRVS